jgi:hypothetical protein
VVYLRGLDRVRLIGHRAPPNEVDVSPKNLLFLINKELYDPRREKKRDAHTIDKSFANSLGRIISPR